MTRVRTLRVGLLLAGALLLPAACSDGEAPPTSGPSPTGTPSASPTPTEEAADDLLTLAPGRVGRAEVLMTQAEAAATNLFDLDVAVEGVEGCERVEPLQWKDEYGEGLDVLTDRDGTIVSMGVWDDSVLTASDVGVGSTYGELVRAYEDALTAAETAGYEQAGVFLEEEDAWLGFLLDTDASSVDDSDEVTFVEVTRGEKPPLQRDGC